MNTLNEGDKVPAFSSTLQDGKKISNKDLKGKKTILFFYPRDMTTGCTAEACNLRDNYASLKKQGFQIYGISNDTEASHVKFIDKHDLPFDLIADTDKSIVNAFGVYGEKKFMGRVYDGIHRKTFIIDENAKIIKRIDKVKTKEHAGQIQDELGL